MRRAGLEPCRRTRLVRPVRRQWIARGIGVGIVAASATAGALLRIGIRDGTPARPFNAIASVVAGSSAAATWGFAGVTLVGVAAHVVATVAWALLAEWLVERGVATRWVAAGVVAVVWLAFSTAIGRIAGNGLSAVVDPGDRVTIALVLAVTLALGMRLAFSSPRRG